MSEIEFSNVILKFSSGESSVNVLDNISFKIEKGESVSLFGRSGSGKTSILMLLAGLERATAGTIKVAGHEITAMSENELADFRSKNIGIVFQSFNLMPTMNARDNVKLALDIAGISHDKGYINEMLESVGLGHRITHLPSQLSGGEQQRLSIARAFAVKPAIVLADEPTGNLDAASGGMVTSLMFDLVKKSGATFVLVTHDQNLANKAGRIMQIGDYAPASVKASAA